ncbi:MAG: S-layer homology domain-containing protein [Clostridiales bacterium]
MCRKNIFCFILCFMVFTFVPSMGVLADDSQASDDSQVSADAKLVAITFDDGPGPYTAKLLDNLKANNAKATFFVVGNRVAANKNLILREFNEGHQIGNHSWDHPKLTAGNLAHQLNTTASAISAVTGESGFFLRPPYGSYNDGVKSGAGVPLILWSVDTLDWKYRNAETVKNSIVNNAKDGSIILLHDIHGTSVDGFIAAMDILKDRGYEFVTVSELMRRRGVTPIPGHVYTSIPKTGQDLPGKIDDGADFDESKLDTHWAYESIQFVKNRGLFKGTSENVFSPDKYMTRGMFVTVLGRMSGEILSGFPNPFSDVVSNEWYGESVTWAAAHGIVKGATAKEFEPDAFITREQMCAILARYGDYKKIDLTGKNPKVTFNDDGKFNDYARGDIYRMQQCGIVKGIENNLFDPQGKATRAQVATICQRFVVDFVDAPIIIGKINATFADFSLPKLIMS